MNSWGHREWGGGDESEQVTSLSSPLVLLVLLASASSTHFLEHLILGSNIKGGGLSPILCLSSFAFGKKDSVQLNTPSNFPVQYFLLFSCLSNFYTLRPFQIILLTSSWGAGRREIKWFVGGRV